MIIAKYKYDSSIYANFVPVFNNGYSGYTISDEVDGNMTTRTIECDTLPTLMRFGNESAADSRTNSLLEVLDINTSGLTSCNSMFRYNKNLTSITCEWSVTNVTTMNNMFNYCNNLSLLDVSKWDTGNVTDMSNMFSYCNKLTSLDVSNWDTSNVTTMALMFYECQNLQSLDVSKWDTSNVTTMRAMFTSLRSVDTLHLGNWDISKVTDMEYMFEIAYSLKILDVSNWDMTNVKVTTMFGSITKLDTVKCNNADSLNKLISLIPDRTELEQGTIISDAELSGETLASLASKNWTVVTSDALTKIAEYVYDSDVWNSMIPIFDSELISYFIDDEDIEGEDADGTVKTLVKRTIWSLGGLPTIMRFGSYTGSVLSTEVSSSLISIESLDISRVTDCANMFSSCTNLVTVNSSNWDIRSVTTMYKMFYNCQSLTSLDVSNWNTSNVINMRSMFNNCFNLTTLDVSKWNTTNVTNMSYMFNSCNKLTSLDVSNFDTSKVTDMNSMFYNCNNLTSLDVSNFNTSNVTDMSGMFTNTTSLTDIGMVYCNPSTVSKLSSVLNTQVRNVYVECDPLCYDKYQYITYMQYKEDKKALLYLDDETNTWKKPILREWDSIEKHSDGKYYYHKRSGEIVLNGSEDWKYRSEVTDDGLHSIFSTSNLIMYNKSSYMLCDKISTLSTGGLANAYSKGENLGFYSGNTSTDYVLYYNVKKSKLSTQDVAGFKAWLKANPIIVVYQLAQEEVYECISLDIMSHFNTTNLEINSGVIIPKTTLRLQESVPNVVRELQEKVSMLENELVLLKIDKILSDIQDIINE